MTFPRVDPFAVELFQYSISSEGASAGQAEQRSVFVGSHDGGYLQVWGEVASGQPSPKAELCQIYLEYARYCTSWCNPTEARYHMQKFGEKLGQRLASYFKQNPQLLGGQDPAVGELRCLFASIGACYSTENIQAGMKFIVTECPLDEAARRTGSPDVELARHGINAMCRRMVLDTDPGLNVSTSPDFSKEFTFTISAMPVE